MDRRFLLAMVLSTIVVVVFYTFFIPAPRKPGPAATGGRAAVSDTIRGTAPPTDTTTLAEAPRDTLEPAGEPAWPDTVIGLRAGRVDAEFSTRGGGIRSWKLLDFEGAREGEPVQLVRGEPEPALVLDLGGRRHDLTDRVFRVERRPAAGGGEELRFQTTLPGGVQVARVYTVMPDSPLVRFAVEVGNVPASIADAAIEVGWSGLPGAERTPNVDKTAYGSVISIGEQVERLPAGRFKKERTRRFEGVVHWAGARNKYFLAGIIPPEGMATAAIATGDAAADRAGAMVRVPVPVGGSSRQEFRVYLGPLDYWKLKDVGFGLERAVDLGWKIILPLSQALLWLMVHGYTLIPNYGIVIILLSALTKVLFYPMTKSSMKSMRAMQKLQPEMERVRNKYKDDPTRLNQEVMGLYRKHKVNPVGGCLPMLLQMPVFIALYTVLANSVELRHASFVGWIDDLSSPDTLFRIGGFAFHVLPILMAGSMFWQQKLTPTDPRQAALTYLMPVMMLVFFYGFPSGLSLYWTVTNLLSVLQQHMINRENAAEEPPAPAGPAPGRKKATAAVR